MGVLWQQESTLDCYIDSHSLYSINAILTSIPLLIHLVSINPLVHSFVLKRFKRRPLSQLQTRILTQKTKPSQVRG
jgi:hypothetical protein